MSDIVLDYANSRAILIGVSSYLDPSFPQVHAAANSLRDMREILTDSALCGWPKDRVISFPDPENVGRFAYQLRRIAERTTGVLLFYFVGHGTITRRGDLCLTLTDTDADGVEYSGLDYSKVKEILIDSPAQIKVAILDCCYSGRAIEALAGTETHVADSTDIRGVYTLTAADQAAHVAAPDEQEYARTSFTAELTDLIRAGINDGPSSLTLNLIYGQLLRRLVARNLPRPNQRGTDTADRYPFTKNVAVTGGIARAKVPSKRPVKFSSTEFQVPVGTPRVPTPGNGTVSPQPTDTTWPDPDSIRTVEDRASTLRRTWVRAGAPKSDEIERRTGGLVNAGTAENLLAKTLTAWTDGDWNNVLLFLEACGVPEHIIKKWGDAARRVNRNITITQQASEKEERRRRRKLMVPYWQARVPIFILIDITFFFLIGVGISQVSRSDHLGDGNWWAFGVSGIVLLFVIWAINFIGIDAEFLDALGKMLSRVIPLLCAMALAVGWFKLEVPVLASAHITFAANGVGRDVLNWMTWRF